MLEQIIQPILPYVFAEEDAELSWARKIII